MLKRSGAKRERVERGEHARLGIAVEREHAPLLNQRARHRLGERPLRQAELERRALAFVAGLVARGQDHRHVDAGPGMLGQILGGLSDAVLGARLRQRQREIGRIVERARRLAVGSGAGLQPEGRLRADDAVIVLELVVELQGAARLAFRILGERDGRRLVRDGGELPADVARGRAAHGRRAGIVDHEAALLGALGTDGLRAGRQARRARRWRPRRDEFRWRGSPACCRPAPRWPTAVCTGSPGRRPCRISGGLPV